jgi:TIR domain-containing protein/restriction endonuclease
MRVTGHVSTLGLEISNWRFQVKAHSIFLSHASEDVELARQYADGLTRHGYDVWLDATGLQVGANLSAEITTQLNGRTALVVLWTPTAVTKPNVAKECKYFIARLPEWPHKRFVPVHTVECNTRADLNLGLTYEQILEEWSPGQYFYVDGRHRPILETVREIDRILEEPLRVPPPLRLETLTESELVAAIRILIANQFGYSFPDRERQLGGTSSRVVRADLITIRADTIVGGGETILVEVKKGSPSHVAGMETVHQLEALMVEASAQVGWLMITGQFATEVLAYCSAHSNIKLFDRSRLVKLLGEHRFKVTSAPMPTD